MKITNKNILLFPIDTVARELEWQLFLALEAKRRFGCNSIIGHKYVIKQVHGKSNNCIWVGRLPTNHGASKGDERIVKVGKQKGTRFLYLHDEGAFYPIKNYRKSVLQIHPIKSSKITDQFKFLTWGQLQKDILLDESTKKNVEIKCSVTGMPRFDLFKPAYDWWDIEEVNRLKDKFGDFSLIITKFGNANSSEHASGLISEKFLRANKMFDTPERVSEYFQRWKKDHFDFSSYVVMMYQVITNLSNHKFIIRPHPSEDSSFYKQVFGYLSNVEIVREGDVRPWIKASNALIHTGCTTGVEASLARKKVINFLTEHIQNYDIAIANEAGVNAYSVKEVIEELSNDSITNNFSTKSRYKLYNLDESSFEKVLREIELQVKIDTTNIAKAKIDSTIIRKLKWIKNQKSNIKNAKLRGVKSGDFGRTVRLSNFPKNKVNGLILNYNKHYKTTFEPKVLGENILVV